MIGVPWIGQHFISKNGVCFTIYIFIQIKVRVEMRRNNEFPPTYETSHYTNDLSS